MAATYPCGQPGSFLCVSLEVFATPTRRYHGRMLIHPSLPACATPEVKGCSHTRRFGTFASRRRLLSTCLGDPIPLAIDHLFLTFDFCQVPRRNFLQFFPFLVHCCFCCRNFHSLRHRNKFVHQIIVLQ